MHLLLALILTGLALPRVRGAAVIRYSGDEEIGKVTWGPCTIPGALNGTECGFINVPLDYFNASAGTARIALAKFPATKSPRKGMVMWNAGGPGAPATLTTATAGIILQRPVGEDYDIVGFDPRGIGFSEPATKCFIGAENYSMFIEGTTLERGYDLASNISTADLRPGLLAQQEEADRLYLEQAEMCKKTMGQTIAYMGTSSNVRDIDLITTALEGQDALINFWGFSYGSVMGQYLVNMFPDRVGRVLIDGVVDAQAWVEQPYFEWYQDWMVNVTDAYNIFLEQCAAAGPQSCALAVETDGNSSCIGDRIETFINGLYYTPLGNLTAGRMRDYIMKILPSPSGWPDAAVAIAGALGGNSSAVLPLLEPELKDMERRAVSCNDNKPFPPPSPEKIVDLWLANFENVTREAFAFPINEPDAGCQYWPVTPPERYDGPWNKTLRNPVLILSNTADPATPMVNGKIVAERMGENARILITNGPGHTSQALPSVCTNDAIRVYFANGTLPVPGTICPVDSSAFPPPNVGLGDASSSLSSRQVASPYDGLLGKFVAAARRGAVIDLGSL